MGVLEIEVFEKDSDGYLSSSPAQRLDSFSKRAPEVTASILEVASTVQQQLEAESSATPAHAREWNVDSLNLSFQLALEAEAGVVIARAKTAATFSVEVSWKRDAPS